MPLETKKQLFQYGGLPKSFEQQTQTFMETAIMVRDPALEILHYLRTADYTCPAIRYIICILSSQLFYLKTLIPYIVLKIESGELYSFWNINIATAFNVILHLCIQS
jgi:hypothetical protein